MVRQGYLRKFSLPSVLLFLFLSAPRSLWNCAAPYAFLMLTSLPWLPNASRFLSDLGLQLGKRFVSTASCDLPCRLLHHQRFLLAHAQVPNLALIR